MRAVQSLQQRQRALQRRAPGFLADSTGRGYRDGPWPFSAAEYTRSGVYRARVRAASNNRRYSSLWRRAARDLIYALDQQLPRGRRRYK